MYVIQQLQIVRKVGVGDDACAVPPQQRGIWNGPPERLSDAFRLTKQKSDSTLSAVCEVWSHEFGWELRLMIDGHGLQKSSVARSASEMNETADQWRTTMLAEGWS
jgi:hypothetical protein